MWVLIFAILFCLLGVLVGLNAPVQIPVGYARYTAVMLLAAVDSIFGAFKALLNRNYENRVFLSGLLANTAVAGGLTYLGDTLGIELYIAAVVAFGVRIFDNLGVIRRHLL